MKHSLPAALAASLSIAAPSLQSVDNARQDCDSVEVMACPSLEPHPTDNRELELEFPTPSPVTQGQVPTFRPTIGATITVLP
jgi:hypothetical protein